MPLKLGAYYPTDAHRDAAEAIIAHFAAIPAVEAVVLVNSCARGAASRDSCLDINVLVPSLAGPEGSPEYAAWEDPWQDFYRQAPVFDRLHGAGRFAEVHLDFKSGQFTPGEHYQSGGPDYFEVEVGNFCAYSYPLWERGNAFQRMKAPWLPYYGDDLRQERLKMVRAYCENNLEHIPLYAARGLIFQCFNRLYDAYREFLQLLFISRRVYPIAYDKWIRQQIVDILGLPELYDELTDLIALDRLEAATLNDRADRLRGLLARYIAG